MTWLKKANMPCRNIARSNLLLALFFAARRGFLVPDRTWLVSLAKFLLTGVILAAAFWLIARFSGSALGAMHFRDELTLVLLAVGGTIVYALAILMLFGRSWLVSLVRGEGLSAIRGLNVVPCKIICCSEQKDAASALIADGLCSSQIRRPREHNSAFGAAGLRHDDPALRGCERCRRRMRQSAAHLQDANNACTSLDLARLPCYSRCMIKSSRKLNCIRMTRFGWAVEGVAR